MPPRPHRQAGFTLIELLITLGLMVILLLIAVGPINKFMHRAKIEGIARETSTLMRLARFEAIKWSGPARVVADGPNDRVFAYAELSNPLNAVFDAGVDREIGRYQLPNGIAFRAYGGVEEDDSSMWNMLGPAGAQWVEFDGSGAVVVAPDAVPPDILPAIRLADNRENYLEVNLAARATGRVELRKWDDGAPAENGTKYVTQGQNGRPWVWY